MNMERMGASTISPEDEEGIGAKQEEAKRINDLVKKPEDVRAAVELVDRQATEDVVHKMLEVSKMLREQTDVVIKSRTLGKNILGKVYSINNNGYVGVEYYNEKGQRLIKDVPVEEFLEWQKEKPEDSELEKMFDQVSVMMREGGEVIIKSKTLGKNVLGKIKGVEYSRGEVNVLYSTGDDKVFLTKDVPIAEFLEWQKDKVNKN